MNILGTQTKSVFLKQVESHKLHQEFEVAEGSAVKVGMPVKMNAVGEIVPLADDDDAGLCLGYSVHNAAGGETATIGMKAFAIVFAISEAAITTVRPVKVKGVSTVDTDLMSYENIAVGATEVGMANGWALDAASGAGEKIRIALI